jgi:dihydropteroate synthase
VDWINDVYALQDERAVELVAKSKVSVCLYHCKGSPQIMQQAPAYEDVVRDVYDYLAARLDVCLTAGVAREKIILDPGFGFGKTLAHNLSLLKHLSAFKPLNCQLLAGLSRKSMFQHLLGRPVEARLPASLAAAVIAYQNGADIIRAHDVQATKDALTVAAAVMKYEENISHHD